MKPTIAVDLDGVLAQYGGWKGVEVIGEPVARAREFLVKIREMGCEVMIYTTRCCEDVGRGEKAYLLVDRVRAWLEEHDMPYDTIWSGQGKPIYFAVVDDRAFRCRPQPEGKGIGQTAFGYTLRGIRQQMEAEGFQVENA